MPDRFSRRGALPDAWELGVLALIAILGLVNLPVPLGGDQALFAVYARGMDAGSVLYRDLWDSKQPGIFFFYLLAGRLFGYNEIGVHALELVVLLAFSFVLMRTSRSFLEHRFAQVSLPLFTVGLFYLVAQPKEMAQVEVLAGFPLYLVLWFSTRATGSSPSRALAFASGVVGGLIAWLKLYLLPIPGAFWWLALIRSLRESRPPSRAWTRLVFPTALGFAVPVLGLVAWAHVTGVLDKLWWTYFVYPRSMAEVIEPDPLKFGRTLLWFFSHFAVPCLYAGWGAWAAARGRRHPVLAGAAAWIATGVLLVIVEQSWWKYYLLILMVPLGVLATVGLDEAIGLSSRRLKVLLAILTAVALVPAAGAFAWKASVLAHYRLALNTTDRLQFQRRMDYRFAEALRQAEFVRQQVGPDETVHVLGTPMIMLLAGKNYVVPINGWSPEVWSPQMWAKVLTQLEVVRPDYVYVDVFSGPLMRRRYPAAHSFLTQAYQVVRQDEKGVWLKKKAEKGTDLFSR